MTKILYSALVLLPKRILQKVLQGTYLSMYLLGWNKFICIADSAASEILS